LVLRVLMALVEILSLTKQFPSGQKMRFHWRFTCCILWVRMCEKETDMALLARFPRSMHCLRQGIWYPLVDEVHDICDTRRGASGQKSQLLRINPGLELLWKPVTRLFPRVAHRSVCPYSTQRVWTR
jgi:hypothetical protein